MLVTDWDVFSSLDLKRLHDGMRCPVLVDLRNVCSRTEAEAAGFAYTCIGHGQAPRVTPLLSAGQIS